MKIKCLTIVAAVGICPAWLSGATLPHIFGDHMVLQAGKVIPVWGTSEPRKIVVVQFGGERKETKADAQGNWRVELPPVPPTNSSAELVVDDGERKIFSDVLVGEVWLCSGQSNMEKPLGAQKGQLPVYNAGREIQAAEFPAIRLFKVKKARSSTPAADVEGEWVRCTPESIERVRFSAVGYFFGRKLHRELDLPVGLIDSTWGGTGIDLWISPAGYKSVAVSAEKFRGAVGDGAEASVLYNGMIQPLVPFALRGAIWYQGEHNVNEGPIYADLMETLVHSWREAWGEEFSFYFVQIAPFLYHVQMPGFVASPEAAPLLWAAQAKAAERIPRSGLVGTSDLVDDLTDIHPRNKRDVGERLARWALAKDYGRKEVEVSGPIISKREFHGSHVIVHFSHANGALVSRDQKPLTWFTLAGVDGVYYPAEAEIQGEAVVVTSRHVPKPTSIRFAWDEAARPNLANREGLPAMPFRSSVCDK